MWKIHDSQVAVGEYGDLVPKLSVAIKNGQCEQLHAEMRKREKELLAVKPINTDKMRSSSARTAAATVTASAVAKKNSGATQDEKGESRRSMC